jgi:hypothetical protein
MDRAMPVSQRAEKESEGSRRSHCREAGSDEGEGRGEQGRGGRGGKRREEEGRGGREGESRGVGNVKARKGRKHDGKTE